LKEGKRSAASAGTIDSSILLMSELTLQFGSAGRLVEVELDGADERTGPRRPTALAIWLVDDLA
jgi:hypothetical protein